MSYLVLDFDTINDKIKLAVGCIFGLCYHKVALVVQRILDELKL